MNPIPGDYDIEIYRGRKQGWRAQCFSDAKGTQKTPLTGCTVIVAIRPLGGGEPVPLTASVVDDADYMPEDGVLDFEISAANAALLTGTMYSWTAVVIDAGGDPHPILRGTVRVLIDDTVPSA